MARIPTQEVEQLKNDVSVERLVEAAGIKLKKSGKDKVGLCPFHEDIEPSLVVSPVKNLWHCFACQIGGGPIDWVMKVKGVSFRHAVELLKADPALVVQDLADSARVVEGTKRSLPAPVKFDADDQQLLNQCVSYYHETLQQSPEALAYLKARGLDHPKLVTHFKLGYANRTLGLRLPFKNRKEGLSIRSHLQKIGIYRESGHEHFNGSLIVPVFSETGNVTEVYGRKVQSALRKGTPLHLYLPTACHVCGRGVWNIPALAQSREVILCEALIDALTFWCAGYTNVISAYGIEGFTEDHLAVLRQYGTQRVWIAYDRDEAGDQAAERVARVLLSRGIECLRVRFPMGMDANSYALSMQPARESLGMVLRQAEWMGKPTGEPAQPTAGAMARMQDVARAKERLPVYASADVRLDADALAGAPVYTHERVPVATLAPEHASALASALAPMHTQAPTHTLAPAPAPTQAPSPTPTPTPAPAPARIASAESAAPIPSLAAMASGATALAPELAQSASASAASDPPEELLITLGDRHWRVRGWQKNLSPEQMRVNLQVRRLFEGGASAFHVDTLDLYAAKARAAYIKQAALEVSLPEADIKRDLGSVLLRLEHLQDGLLSERKQPLKKVKTLTLEEESEAMALLTAPDLVTRIVADMGACGVVGEANNLLAGYLAAVSRKLDTPLAILIQSSSAAGKSSLMDAVLAMVPEEERVQYSAMTGQSLFYLGETDMQHKILAIAEEEGVRQAAYALKLLQSDGELTMASTGKDEASGDLVTKQYKVKGPVMLMLTTTAIDVDEELMNRCLVLTVNESREQTRAIHERQRAKQTLAGLLASNDKQHLTALHQNAQRLLKPVLVVNPFADQLTFLDDKTRTRRDHMKYLTLIRAIALLHQHQREVKTVEHRGQTLAYIEATKGDIALANQIAHEVLGRTLDELPPQTRNLLTLVQAWVGQQALALGLLAREFRFTRKELRDVLRWGDTQLRLHMSRLVEMEYLMAYRSGTTFTYELVYDGQKDGGSHLCGLIDVNILNYDRQGAGLTHDLAPQFRPESGPVSGHSRGTQNADFSYEGEQKNGKLPKTQFLERKNGPCPVIALDAKSSS